MPNEPLKFTTRINNGKVDVVFDAAVVRLSMTPEQARAMAKILVIKADIAEERKGESNASNVPS